MNPFCVLTFGTSGCGRQLPQGIVFMKTVNNAIKLANSLCQLSAGSLIPVQSARKPLQKKKKLPRSWEVVVANLSDRGSRLSQHAALLRRTRRSRSRKPPALGPDGNWRRSLSIGGRRRDNGPDGECGHRRGRRRSCRFCDRSLGLGAAATHFLGGHPGGRRSSEGHLGSRRRWLSLRMEFRLFRVDVQYCHNLLELRSDLVQFFKHVFVCDVDLGKVLRHFEKRFQGHHFPLLCDLFTFQDCYPCMYETLIKSELSSNLRSSL